MARKATAAQEEGRNLDGTVITSRTADVAEPPSTDGDGHIPSRALAAALCRIGASLVGALRRRASADERATVRKSAVGAWFEMLNLAHQEKKTLPRPPYEEFGLSALDMYVIQRSGRMACSGWMGCVYPKCRALL